MTFQVETSGGQALSPIQTRRRTLRAEVERVFIGDYMIKLADSGTLMIMYQGDPKEPILIRPVRDDVVYIEKDRA